MTNHAITASGPVPVDRLGRVLMHEHALSLVPGGWVSGDAPADRASIARLALTGLSDAGIDTIVDLTTRAVPPQRASTLRWLAEQTGVDIVVGVGFYKSGHLPDDVADASVGWLTDWYEQAAVQGADGTGVRAGCFGELGTSLDEVTDAEARNLRAAARAHVRTGVPISTHCTVGTMGPEQVALLAGEGVDLSRVVIGHQDLAASAEPILAVLEAGANVGFDTFGKEWFDYPVGAGEGGAMPAPAHAHSLTWACRRRDADRLDVLLDLLERGYADRIVLSTDLLGRELHANAVTHGSHGYRYLPEVVVPQLRRRGIDEATLHTMLVDNPARILGVRDVSTVG